MNVVRSPWVIVLAGGHGERLRAVTACDRDGSVPKQFCRLAGPDSLLASTLGRARGLADADRIVVAVLEAHRRWWEPELRSIRSDNLLVQPENRGTALALLRALLHVQGRDPGADVVVLPSDHVVDDEGILRATILEAASLAARRPRLVVLLGAPALAADRTLGWIIPARAGSRRVSTVAEFVEKPGPDRAAACLRRGGLRNTLIMAGGVQEMLDLYASIEPQPLAIPGAKGLGLSHGSSHPAALPWDRASLDLGRDVFEPAARRLRVISLPECGWSDIGTPARLRSWWRTHPAALAHARRHGILPRAPHAPSGSWSRVERFLEPRGGTAVYTGTDGPHGDDAA